MQAPKNTKASFGSKTALAAVLLVAAPSFAKPTLPSHTLGNGEGAAGSSPSSGYFLMDPDFRCAAGSAGPSAPGYRKALIHGEGSFYDPCTDRETALSPEQKLSIRRPREYVRGFFIALEGEFYEYGTQAHPPASGPKIVGWCESHWGESAGRSGVFGSDVILYRDGGRLSAELYLAAPTSGPGRWREVRWVMPFPVENSGASYRQEAFSLDLSPRPDGLSALRADVDGQDDSDLVSCILGR
jgi:hypothetical protein